MNKFFDDVLAFHTKFGLILPQQFTPMGTEAYNFRLGFIKEEFKEFQQAIYDNNLIDGLDALIDTIYVAVGGAQFLGFTAEDWSDAVSVTEGMKFNGKPNKTVSFLSDGLNSSFVNYMNALIGDFVNAHYHESSVELIEVLVKMCKSCEAMMKFMGCSTELINDGWNDVQRANMTKVRATAENQGKRGTSLDVLKPVGWQGPQWLQILEAHGITTQQSIQTAAEYL